MPKLPVAQLPGSRGNSLNDYMYMAAIVVYLFKRVKYVRVLWRFFVFFAKYTERKKMLMYLSMCTVVCDGIQKHCPAKLHFT